jgi:copper chaperone CopZ
VGRIAVVLFSCAVLLCAKEWTLHISGMHCIACTLAVKKALIGVSGVSEVKVNFKNETATLNANDTVTLKMMQNAVEATGYKAELFR